LVEINLPMPPEPDDEEEDDEILTLALFTEISLEGVTSGADPTVWDPIRIEREQARETNDDVLDTSLEGGDGPAPGVTSGNDIVPTEVKSSERKFRQPQH
jgi:hypothetical protein